LTIDYQLIISRLYFPQLAHKNKVLFVSTVPTCHGTHTGERDPNAMTLMGNPYSQTSSGKGQNPGKQSKTRNETQESQSENNRSVEETTTTTHTNTDREYLHRSKKTNNQQLTMTPWGEDL